MDIILHLGAHRTGTVAFHSYLRANRAELARLRVAVWEPEMLRAGLGAGLTGPVLPPNPALQVRVQRSLGRIGIELARLDRRGLDRLLVTEPGLIGNLHENLAAGALYPQLLPRLARLSGTLGPRCSRVVLGVRSYDSYWASALAQAVPSGFPVPTPDKLAQLVAQPRRWRHLIAEIATAFPRAECLILPYEALAGQLDLQLAMALGEPVPALAGARLRLHLRPTRAMLREALADRRENPGLIAAGEGPWQMFDPVQVAALQGFYAADLAWLRQGADGLARVMDGGSGCDAGTGQESGDDGQGAGTRGRGAASLG